MKNKILVMTLLISSYAQAWEVPFSPDSTLLNTPDHQGTIQTLMWLTKSIVVSVCLFLLYSGSKNLNDENYYNASLSLVGALIAGGATYYALPLA